MSTKELTIAHTLDAIKQILEEFSAEGFVNKDSEYVKYLAKCGFQLRGHWARDHRELSKIEELEEARLRS